MSPKQKMLAQLKKSPRIWFGGSVLLIAGFVAIFSKYLVPYDPTEMDLTLRIEPPSLAHWFGCDLNGGDVFSSVILGTSSSLSIAFSTVTISMTFGTIIGLCAGYFRGFFDTLCMRFIDILMAFPGILLAMALASLLGPSKTNMIIAIAATGWTGVARLVRGQVLSLKEREYILACKAMGASHKRTIFKHVFPEIWSPLIVLATFSLSGVILVEASLSFLGLGAQEGAPSWGALLDQGRTVLEDAPHISVFPGICIVVVVLGLNFLGDALRDILDPKQQ